VVFYVPFDFTIHSIVVVPFIVVVDDRFVRLLLYHYDCIHSVIVIVVVTVLF